MPYDALGNYYEGPEEQPSAPQQQTYYTTGPNGVPVINYGTPAAAPSPTLAELAAKYNPLMLRKALQDASGTIAMGGVLPVVAPWSAGIQNVAAQPGILYRKYLGDEKSLQEAADIEKNLPTTEQLKQKYGQAIAPKTELGQEMVEGVGKAMQRMKVPDAWPLTPAAPRRPMLTPDDVRVMYGQGKQTAREVRDVPTDFQNAQSGVKRQNVYGEDTLGVKLQSAADDIGRIMEERQLSGRQTVPGVPDVLQPPSSRMYAVRPEKTRIVQPSVPSTAGGFRPDQFTALSDLVDETYGPTPAKDMPASMVMTEYNNRFIRNNDPLLTALRGFEKSKAMEMFPDAPSEAAALRAFELRFAENNARKEQNLAHLQEFFNTPEGAQFREQGIPTPGEFMERMAEGERIIKGPLVNFLSKNLGAVGDPGVKLARQGITYETPDRIKDLATYVNKPNLALIRQEAGQPAMGTYADENFAKQAELDKLNQDIQALEEVRQPLFDRAHQENINPATIPEYAETTSPLRAKLREREKLQDEMENIRLAMAYEDVTDYSVKNRSKEQLIRDIPYEQRQFYPSVTKAGENENLYTVNRQLMKDVGFEKLGKDLLEDILDGKAGDTSKLTIENYIRQKGLSRIEAEKAAKLQAKQYRQALEGALVQRLRNDPSVKTYGNTAAITLTKDTPKDVALRDMSTDTAVLDHCVGQGGTAPSGRKNILTGQQQYYEPIIDPVTGERNKNVRDTARSSYVEGLETGGQLVSFRDVQTGLPAATFQLHETGNGDGKFDIGFASGAKNGAIDEAYSNGIRDYLNERSDEIRSVGSNLSDNAGVFDMYDARGFQQATRAAKLATSEQQQLLKNSPDLPRFVTSDDLKKIYEGIAPEPSTAVAVRDETPAIQFTERDHQGVIDDYNSALENATRDALENSSLENPERVERGVTNIATGFFELDLNNQANFLADPVYQIRRVETALEDRIANLHAQGSDYHGEVADALDNFLIDVRGIRGNFERRIRMAEEQAAADRNELGQLHQELGIAPQGDPLPEMSADELLQAHSDRLSPEQRNWLQNFIQRWDNDVDNTPAGATAQEQLSRTYGDWLATNRLGPDPVANLFDDMVPDDTHPANNVALQQRPGGNQPYAPEDLLLARRLLDIEREPDGTLRQNGIDATAYALQTGQLDHYSVGHIPPGPERAARLEPVLRAFIDEVARERQPAPGGNQPLTGRDRDLLTTFNELVNEATAEGSFPGGLANIDLAQLVRENEIGGLEELGQADRSRLIELLERQQQPVPAGRDPYAIAEQYNVPPGMIRSILTESNGPVDRLFELLNEALTPLWQV
jgi:hypothetical protein